jgi:hypothetical protein
MHLIVDDREHDVITFIRENFNENEFVIARLEVGDFAIADNDKLLAAFERKTLPDFARSMKSSDRRYENISKMVNLRNKSGVKVYVIIENDNIFLDSKESIEGIKINGLIAAIDLLSFRSDIPVFYTRNPYHTSLRLKDFVARFNKIVNDEEKGRISSSLINVVPIENSPNILKESNTNSNTNSNSILVSNPSYYEEIMVSAPELPITGGKKTLSVPMELKTKVVHSDDYLAKEMWHCLDGVSIKVAEAVINKFSVVDLIKNATEKSIKELKTENGRKISAKAASSLIDLKKKNIASFTKILSGVPGISKSGAEKIMSVIDIDSIINKSVNELSEIKIDGKRIAKKMENIVKYINYSRQPIEDKKINMSSIKLEEKKPTNNIPVNPTNSINANSINSNPTNTNSINANSINSNPTNTNPINSNPINSNTINTNPTNINPISASAISTGWRQTDTVTKIHINCNAISTSNRNANVTKSVILSEEDKRLINELFG